MKIKNLSILLLAIGAISSFSSCRKKLDTIAKIIVRDTDNVPVVGAEVTLACQSTLTPPPSACTLNKTGTTNGSGEAVFNFNDTYQLGQAGVAVLNIIASKGGSTATGIIKVEQEVTNEETVFLP